MRRREKERKGKREGGEGEEKREGRGRKSQKFLDKVPLDTHTHLPATAELGVQKAKSGLEGLWVEGRELSRPDLLHQCTKPCTEMALGRWMKDKYTNTAAIDILCYKVQMFCITAVVICTHMHQLTLHAASLSVSEPDITCGTWILGSGNGTHICPLAVQNRN